MSELFAAFGIDWRLLIINMVNFGLMLGLLWYFLYHPILRILESRREKIAQGVRDAEAAQRARAEIEEARAKKLAAAGHEADLVLAQVRSAATAREREIMARAESASQSLLQEAEAQAQETKSRAIAESREEVAKLVVLGMEKMLAHKK